MNHHFDALETLNESELLGTGITHINAEVRLLNEEARERLRVSGDLGADVAVQAERSERSSRPATGSCSCATSVIWG